MISTKKYSNRSVKFITIFSLREYLKPKLFKTPMVKTPKIRPIKVYGMVNISLLLIIQLQNLYKLLILPGVDF